MANELAFNTFLGAATLTEQVVGEPIEFRGVSGGGGGARPTGDVGQNASGGGGEAAKVVKASAEASYTLTPGDAGVAGVDSAATNGGDTTVTDSSGVILRAKGGLKGIAAWWTSLGLLHRS